MRNIRDVEFNELAEEILKFGQKKFRAKQIWEWVWKKRVTSFDEMRNIPKQLIDKLKENYAIDTLQIVNVQKDKDKTIKVGFECSEGNLIEGVIIPSGSKTTACISTQVGCKLNCGFCATGTMGFKKNLTVAEIYDQVFELNKIAVENNLHSLTNIVYMGMGEPLLNYENVVKSIDLITSEDTFGYSPRRITVSTAGIAKMINKLADDDVKFNLAISLHSAIDRKRGLIMPINKSNNLKALAESIQYFHKKTNTRITYEYLLLNQFNDTLQDAKELAEFCKISPCKINVIEYNSVDGISFEPSNKKTTDEFVAFLESKNLIVNVRRSRGKEIDAACGQLANKRKAKN